MAWTTPATWVNTEIVTITKLHTQLRDDLRETWHEMAYAERTSVLSTTSTNPASPDLVVSSGAVTYPAVPIIVEFFSPQLVASASNTLTLMLWDDTTDLGRIGLIGAASMTQNGPCHLTRRLTPTAGSHTFKVMAYGNISGLNVAGNVGGTNVQLPCFIRVLAKGGA